MNYLFLANALVETTAGAVALVSPKTLPMFSHVNSQGKSAARWWAVAVIALGIASFVARNGKSDTLLFENTNIHITMIHDTCHTTRHNRQHTACDT
eukprot:TRINITY_DN3577_c0_g1_i3.p1 TRINITY_DN3577_c0_g1~~TRINITY_DN3577_c0_g1_i3.p1  ORF type:complete len:109 (+),score=17.23 TRINITY_DN3577_c0_g1_i3:42-329(+)